MSAEIKINKNLDPHSLFKPWERRSTYCGRMVNVPVIGHIIRAIIWLFKKIFPCCFPKEPIVIPKPQAPSPSKLAPIVPQEAPKTKIEQKTDLERVLKLPPELRSVIIKDLNYRDLTALQMALQSDKTKSKYDSEKSQLKTQVQKIRETDIVSQKRILNKILSNNPEWVPEVNSWTKISVQDKVWLLQMYELFYFGRFDTKRDIFFPEFTEIFDIDKNFSSDRNKPFSSGQLLDLLKYKREMTKILASMRKISFHDLKTLPDALHLLSNLEELSFSQIHFDPFDVSKFVKLRELRIAECSFTSPPDFSKNVHLETLVFEETKLTIPPDVSKNLKLKGLTLFSNQLKILPDLRQNINLEALWISQNPITTPPNVTGNPKLQMLILNENQLTIPPDVSRNPKLQVLNLNENQLTTSPDVSQNPNLLVLSLNQNQLTITPDVNQCPNLTALYLHNNQLTMPPDVSQNLNLEELTLSFNPLTNFPDVSQHQKLRKYTRDQEDPGNTLPCTIL